MSSYEPPRTMTAAASEPKQIHPNGPHPRHVRPHVANRKKRDRDTGAKVLNQLSHALAQSTLDGKLTQNQRKKKEKKEPAARIEAKAPSDASKQLSKKQRKRPNRAAREEVKAQSDLSEKEKPTKKQRKKMELAARQAAKAQSNPSEKQPKLTKSQRKNMKLADRIEFQAHRQDPVKHVESKGKQAQDTTRKIGNMNGMLPLGFDSSYLDTLGDASSFMSNDQTRTWIISVHNSHLESWYHDCLSASANQYRLIAAQNDPHTFTKAVVHEAMVQHASSESLRPLLGEVDTCPTAFHLQMKHSDSLTFVQHSAMVACLVVRDGQRGGAFAACEDSLMLHRAGALLLTSVIMDLKTDFGYF